MDVKSLVNSEKGMVDGRIYSAAEIYERELEQIFARCWLYLGHESQIPNPGDFMATYMGEDPIILWRGLKGQIHAFLNMCRHRGNRVCTVDKGNSHFFTCAYHGWVFSSEGKLVNVPGLKEMYFGELDVDRLGLVEVAQLDIYKGMIFATWDPEAPTLLDYLGDMTWYLDLLVDRAEGGTEVIGGVHRWVINANWKLAVDNFIADMYHAPASHISAFMAGFGGGRRRADPTVGWPGYQINPARGHGLGTRWCNTDEERLEMITPEVAEYEKSILPEMERRLGTVRARKISPVHGTVFPNLSWLFGTRTLRVWHPRGPEKTEIWAWCILDKAAPPEVKRAWRLHCMRRFGPTGTWEQDDMDNWIKSGESGRSFIARRYPLNFQMGLGHERYAEGLPGRVGDLQSEMNNRSFYSFWADLMTAKDWSDLSLTPRTVDL